ncbi:heavy-metal-associated domain-containing protein [Granulicoccus phenolivorans]|uniref:heavy-metal-associated domain-containing protein n=2 Tax=Granulicoccus phenolivorans TaxID=266854 RepID=UPI0007673958|nr:heavy-metal-associated domain-containing protein [Granulicoccus phenolivorans]
MANTPRTLLPMATGGCACCTPDPATGRHETRSITEPAPGTTTYRVDGMTCGHCVASVTRQVATVPGASAVEVDLTSGGVSTVTVTGPVDPDEVRAAITKAGYLPRS